MKKFAFSLVVLLILTVLPLNAAAYVRPDVVADPGSTVEVGTKVVLSLYDRSDKGGITQSSTSYQWYIGDPEYFLVKGIGTLSSIPQPIPGATEDTYEPDTSIPGVTSYFCRLNGEMPSRALILTVTAKPETARQYGYVPDSDAPGFESSAEPAPAAVPPVADANPNTGASAFAKPHFGRGCVK